MVIWKHHIIKLLTWKVCICLIAIYHIIFPSCSKDGASNDSPSGSVSETPKKSSKKSKKNTESMNKVYNSVLDSVFGAVRSWQPHFVIWMSCVVEMDEASSWLWWYLTSAVALWPLIHTVWHCPNSLKLQLNFCFQHQFPKFKHTFIE